MTRDDTLIRQAMRFGAAGAVNTVVGFAAILGAFYGLGLGATASNAIGYAIGFAVSYGLHRRWTFRHSGRHGRSLPRYALVMAAGYAANLGVLHLLYGPLGVPFVAAQVVAMAAFTITVFAGSRLFAFAPERS
ncbi:GtrA family protein [Rhodobacteraceae bacterium CCMM004]|nr:GtrA family protein [Rhodobacteraceae bacterium CCMM004]